ncbi:MFS transporter [Fervidobacterium islandicum]|uniref:MFS transporter n=1 Tax=Fervidobacterium islandicum TaxID=2423 RepID=A0AAI8CM80_FERIS|nr:MFS transporter [Fervidobacterium islandicum]AMW33047.1 MFS transporter [Fervidobacterium islandicum]
MDRGAKDRKKISLFLFLLLVVLNADQMVMSPVIGMIEKEFNITDSHIGLIGGVFSIVGALISLIWGYLTDKYSRKWLLIGSILVGEVPCLLTAISGSYGELFFWRVLTGIGIGASFPISYSLVGDLYGHRERGKIVSVLGLASTVGSIVGMLVAGYTANIFGWRIPFILVSAPNLLLIPLIINVLQEPKRGASEEGFSETQADYSYTIKLSDYTQLVKIKTNLLLFLQGIAGTIPWGAIPYFMIEFFRREKSMDLNQATTMFLLFALGSIAGNIAGGFIGEKIYRRSKKLVPLVSAITTILGVFLTVSVFRYSYTSNTSNGLIGFLTFGMLGFIAAAMDSYTGPNVKMMLLNVNEPKDRGRIFSIFNLTDSVGTGIGRFVGGSLSVTLGTLGAALEITAYFWLVCGFLLMLSAWYFEVEVEALNKKMRELAMEMASQTLDANSSSEGMKE